MQSDEYKHTNEINYLADMVGADRARDRLKVAVEAMDPQLDVTLDGTQEIDLAAQSLAVVDTDVGSALNDSGTALDVSASNVPVESAAPLDVSGATVPIEIAAQTLGAVSTDLAPALASNATDTLQTEQQTPVGVEDSTGTQISPLAAGDQPLDVSAATVTTDPGTSVSAEAFENGTAMASGGSITNSLAAQSADTLRGRVVRASTSYDVTVDWTDSAGTVLFTDTVASAVAAGTPTSLNEPAISPYCDVTVSDAGSASGAVTATLHLR